MKREHTHLADDGLFEYLDQELSPESRQKIESTLAECAECQERLLEIRRLFGEIESLEAIDLERDLVSAVMERVPGETGFRTLPNLSASLSLQSLVAVLILAASLPALLQQASITELAGMVQDNNRLLLETLQGGLAAVMEIVTQLRIGLEAVLSETVALQTGPIELVLILPLLISTGLLWLVGNGILLRNLSSRRR